MYCKLTCTLMCMEFHIIIQSSHFLVQRTLRAVHALKLFWKSITTESHELSLECCRKENLQFKWQSLNSTTPEF